MRGRTKCLDEHSQSSLLILTKTDISCYTKGASAFAQPQVKREAKRMRSESHPHLDTIMISPSSQLLKHPKQGMKKTTTSGSEPQTQDCKPNITIHSMDRKQQRITRKKLRGGTEDTDDQGPVSPLRSPPLRNEGIEVSYNNVQPGAFNIPASNDDGNPNSHPNNLTASLISGISDSDNESEMVKENEAGGLVVAAQLSDDVEREIEARVRRQIMEEAAKASLVTTGQAQAIALPPPLTSIQVVGTPHKIYKRKQLPWWVEQETATMKWVVTIQTNPRAYALPVLEQRGTERRFFAASKREATEIAMAMATPVPHAVDPTKQQHCSLCQSNFSLFKRKRNYCINCGMGMLCPGCSTTWDKSMIPSTYYCNNEYAKSMVNQNTVNVCTDCDRSARRFQQALLRGDLGEAYNLYKHHNINIRTPYHFLDKKKKEILYPIHAAILGGNLKLVKWFVLNRQCPLLQPARQSPSPQDGTSSISSSSLQPLLTSKGRSPVQLALPHLDILHYLVHDLHHHLMDDQLVGSLDPKLVLTHLAQLLQHVPADMVSSSSSLPQNERRQKESSQKSSSSSTLRRVYEV